MGNETSKPGQVPESENAARLRAVLNDIKNIEKEYDEREAAAQTHWAREDAKRAAATEAKRKAEAESNVKEKEGIRRPDSDQADATAHEAALERQVRLVEKQKERGKAASRTTAAKAGAQSDNSDVPKQVNPPLSSAPYLAVEAQNVLAGWNARREPRRKSSNGDSQTHSRRRSSVSSDVGFARSDRLEADRKTSGSNGRPQSIERDPQTALGSAGLKNNADQANSGALEKLFRAGAPVAARPENTIDLPTMGGKKSELPTRPPSQDTASRVAKRAEPISGFEQSGRRDLAGFTFQKRPRNSADLSASLNSPRLPATTGDEADRERPDWYCRLSVVAKRGSTTGNADALLDRLKNQITALKKLGPHTHESKARLNELRESLHEAPFLAMGVAGPQLLRNKRMLHNNDGLPQLFDDRYAGSMKGHWPWDVRADAAELYQKWCSQNFDDDMLFGLILSKKSGNPHDDRKGDRVDPKRQISSKYRGNGDLVNGQWWPTLLCALRDGAHGDSQAGISGVTGVGAYSCFISGGEKHQYPDKDEGDVVYYYGQDTTTPFQISRGTALLKKSKIARIPVRFIRSSKARTHSKYAPPVGFRYDGLYDVLEYKLIDKEKARYCFTLVRQPGQGPIRGGDGPEARPTQQEIDRFQQDKRFRGFGSKD